MPIDHVDHDETQSNTWEPYKDKGFSFHSGLFARGIVAFKPDYLSTPSTESGDAVVSVRSNTFKIQKREYRFTPTSPAETPIFKINKAAKKKVGNILSLLVTSAKQAGKTVYFSAEGGPAIFNTERREEIFLPLVFEDDETSSGIYLYAWPSATFRFPKSIYFTQFVTAGCLIGGSALKGVDQCGRASYPIIKHDIKFFSDQKFTEILFSPPEMSAYEQTLFRDIERNMLFIQAFSSTDSPKKLLYHVPYYDYILFGVELFLRGRMSLNALKVFAGIVLLQRGKHCQEITQIGEKYEVTVEFMSPFDNLFGIPDPSSTTAEIITHILSVLEMPRSEKNPESISAEEQKRNEAIMVSRCIYFLIKNTHLPEQRIAWETCINIECGPIDKSEELHQISNIIPINDLEKLFQIANTIPIAVAAQWKKPWEVCSIVPVTEKQIQVAYPKKFPVTATQQFPPVMNVTVMESVVTYSPVNMGPLFYSEANMSDLRKPFSAGGLLTIAHQNIGLFARQTQSVSEKAADQQEKIPHEKTTQKILGIKEAIAGLKPRR